MVQGEPGDEFFIILEVSKAESPKCLLIFLTLLILSLNRHLEKNKMQECTSREFLVRCNLAGHAEAYI